VSTSVWIGPRQNRARRNSETLPVDAGADSDALFDVQPRPLLEMPFEPATEAGGIGRWLDSRRRLLLTGLCVTVKLPSIDTHRETV